MLALALFKSPTLHRSINPTKRSHLSPLIMSWSCNKCTFLNSSPKLSCTMCESSPPASPKLAAASSSPIHQWACKACTFLNSYPAAECELCKTGRPVSSLASLKQVISVDDDELDASVGSVFMPLRASIKRKKMDDEGEKTSEFREVKTPSIKEAKLPFDTDSEKELPTLKILSYNMWFREDLEVYERMKAIGDLIQLHSPDVISFQEVTADIYRILKSHRFWKAYRCSVSENEAQLRNYFCMQLSKLPVTKFSCKPFEYSCMERELCLANAEIQTGQSLVVATSHLESPTPGPPTWDQMNSKVRVQQAKEAINFLRNYPNVIFGGDMNWDDKVDGPFPVVEGWVDPWTELRPRETGLTYDTKTNKMLSGNRSLLKRLDRFMCCLRDFKITDISMIGMEAIPGLTHVKEKKVKGEIKHIVLPVFPSDHFGLLLTITSL